MSDPTFPVYKQREVEMNVERPFCAKTNAIVWPEGDSLPLVGSEMVEHGQFRRDLYNRLNVFPIAVPPLRDRPQDIPILTWHFAEKYGRRPMNKRIEKIRTEDMEVLAHYHWPGNVLELQNVIERSVILSSDGVLDRPPIPDPKRDGRNAQSQVWTLEQAEREHILKALRDTKWMIGGPRGAAARLEVRRTSLLYKMRWLGISRPED